MTDTIKTIKENLIRLEQLEEIATRTKANYESNPESLECEVAFDAAY